MLKEMFDDWKYKTDLVKLQYAYAVVGVLALVAAGLIGLLNQDVAWKILGVSQIAAVAFFVNLVSWALVNLLVVPAKPTRRPTPRR